MEYKELDFEIKSIDEKGQFEGIAIPFGNVDLGNDRALQSIAMRNAGKTSIPYLWQHDNTIPIGKVDLIGGAKGIELKGQLFLDTNEQGIPLVPEAQKAYVMMKNNILKNSIGYKTLDYQYTKEDGKTVRDLKDIDIMEVSAVTFPMNPEAAITNVKKAGEDMELQEQINELRTMIQEITDVLKIDEKRIDREYEAARGYISNMATDDPRLMSLYELINGKVKKVEGKKDAGLDVETKAAMEELIKSIKN